MKRLASVIVLSSFLLLLLPVQGVNAQHGAPPPLPADAWKGTVSGNVLDKTTGELLHEPIEVMLHVWDTNWQEIGMLHGQAEANGSFRFEEIDFHQTFVVAVMSTYLGVSYYSEPVNIQKGDTSITIQANVYETTNDISSLSIIELVMLFYIEGGQLGVTQFYAISNSGNLTVKDAVTLPRDRLGSIKFHLPDEAQNVRFGDDSTGNRYVLMAGSFADTNPIPPGEGSSQLAVGYNLPFTGELIFDYFTPLPVKELKILVQEGSELTLQGNGFTAEGEQTLQDGSKFLVYAISNLESEQKVQLFINGPTPVLSPILENTTLTLEPQSKNNPNVGIGIGTSVLGLVISAVGVWMWVRNRNEKDDIDENTIEDLMDEIQHLDLNFERNGLSEEEYQLKRQVLHDQLKDKVNLLES